MFVCWCFVQAFGKSAALKLLCQPSKGNCGAGCGSQMKYYKNKKRFFTSDPQPGDQIIFLSKDKTQASHTGLVYKVDKTYVYTVEGNTSSSSGVIANGGGVFKKKYKLTYDRIAGYGRPDYGVADTSKNDDSSEKEAETSTNEVLTPAWVSGTTSSAVNFRKKPSKASLRVSGMPKIKEGEQVGIKTTDGTWSAVEYKGYNGYVMMEFLTYDNPATKKEDVKQEEVQQPEEETTVVQEQRTYTTVQGDTLWKVSSKFLGAGYKYRKIMKANGMKNTIIRPGMVLKIPDA